MRLLNTLLFTSVVFCQFTCKSVRSDSLLQEDESRAKVIDGTVVNPKDYPEVVQIAVQELGKCTATPVAVNILLTALHCIDFVNGNVIANVVDGAGRVSTYKSSAIYFLSELSSLLSGHRNIISLSREAASPGAVLSKAGRTYKIGTAQKVEYRGSEDDVFATKDIVYVVFPGAPFQKIIPVYVGDLSAIPQGQQLEFFGYGKYSDNAPADGKLRRGTIDFSRQNDPNVIISEVNVAENRGAPFVGHGDSGGPLFATINGQKVVVGVAHGGGVWSKDNGSWIFYSEAADTEKDNFSVYSRESVWVSTSGSIMKKLLADNRSALSSVTLYPSLNASGTIPAAGGACYAPNGDCMNVYSKDKCRGKHCGFQGCEFKPGEKCPN